MNLLWASLIVVGFAALLERLSLRSRVKEVFRHASDSLRVLQDPDLDDYQKELALRNNSRRLFALAGLIILGTLVALAVPVGAVLLLSQAGLASFSDVLGVLERPDFLMGAGLLGLISWIVFRLRG